jgi:uncharacterized protein YecE (DUF72 family)
MAAVIRVGTCSWADEALSKYWYPKGVPPGERLRHYAEHFDTVEVDSTYYRLPDRELVERWAERTGGVRDAREGLRRHDPAPGEGRAASARSA